MVGVAVVVVVVVVVVVDAEHGAVNVFPEKLVGGDDPQTQPEPPVLHGLAVITYDPMPFVPTVHVHTQLSDAQITGYGVVTVVVVVVGNAVVAPGHEWIRQLAPMCGKPAGQFWLHS